MFHVEHSQVRVGQGVAGIGLSADGMFHVEHFVARSRPDGGPWAVVARPGGAGRASGPALPPFVPKCLPALSGARAGLRLPCRLDRRRSRGSPRPGAHRPPRRARDGGVRAAGSPPGAARRRLRRGAPPPGTAGSRTARESRPCPRPLGPGVARWPEECSTWNTRKWSWGRGLAQSGCARTECSTWNISWRGPGLVVGSGAPGFRPRHLGRPCPLPPGAGCRFPGGGMFHVEQRRGVVMGSD